jgi:hypothetical protein
MPPITAKAVFCILIHERRPARPRRPYPRSLGNTTFLTQARWCRSQDQAGAPGFCLREARIHERLGLYL